MQKIDFLFLLFTISNKKNCNFVRKKFKNFDIEFFFKKKYWY